MALLRAAFFLLLTLPVFAQPKNKPVDGIRVNQIGYYPSAPKSAVVAVPVSSSTFFVVRASDKKEVFNGTLSAARTSVFSDKQTRIADFSTFNTPGTYQIFIPSIGYSYPFDIKAQVNRALATASVKAFYYQRLSTALPARYAGKWSRAAGNPDTNVLVHASAVSTERPEGTVLSSPRGWLDAGDYNKYSVNSGITMGTLLAAYEDYPTFFDSLSLNIPESTNATPDLLDEVIWNLRWMLTMQDPADGGVYHKLTNAKFDGMIMPDKALTPRYVVMKGTAATLDFAAVTAQASRVLVKLDPALADSCLQAAKHAWQWALRNPAVVYDQDMLNKTFDPDITTGAYGDTNFKDEFLWAACELYVTTVNEDYARYILPESTPSVLPSWSNVKLLGYYTLIRWQDNVPPVHLTTIAGMRKEILTAAEKLLTGYTQRAYNNVMGSHEKDYIWGSSAVAANQGMLLIQAYRITRDRKYLDAALTSLDYLSGKNATGYSFITGHGDKTPMHPHHRPSIADNVTEPVPGLLAGGPNPGMQDKCRYTSSIADEAYSDTDCSYASNEVAINWNAPLVYVSSALEALQKTAGYGKK
jgi:endoglucanase